MIRNLILAAILLISCQFLFLYSSEDSTIHQQSLMDYLPEDNEIGNWKRDDLPQEYKGEDLYLYINGGAEIYHEYGFKQVVIQDYVNTNGKSISLEVFEMTDSESAYGIYTFKTAEEGKELTLGDAAQLADYYLNFWKGNILVTLTGFDGHEETIKGLLEIARAVERKIKVTGKRPPLASLLPDKELVTSSIKYFKGPLGLYNSYLFFTQNVFILNKGIKGKYRKGHSVFIIEYRSDDEGQKRFRELKESFIESPRYKNFQPVNKSIFLMEDSKGKSIFISPFEKYILIIIGTIHQTQAKKILGYIQGSIRGR